MFVESLAEERILITGGSGLVGRSLTQSLMTRGVRVVSVGNRRGEEKVDLRNPRQTAQLFERVKPTCVFHLAARVGGIYANMHYKAAFYSDNTLINVNVVNEIARHRVPFVFAMGTGCAYPKRLEGSELCEESFLDGVPEPTNDAYAYAKRNLLVHLMALQSLYGCRYVYAIPANIYGPHDNFHPLNSHVIPALIYRFCQARMAGLPEVKVWGTGSAARDFLYIEDLIQSMWIIWQHNATQGPINIATGQQTTIRELATLVADVVGYQGEIVWDPAQPEGQLARKFSTAKIEGLGWRPRFSLREGLARTVEWFERNHAPLATTQSRRDTDEREGCRA